MIEAVIAICIAIVIVLLILLATYNGLMQQRQDVRAAWAQMDETLKRRYDLIPSLVNTIHPTGGQAAAKLAAVSAAKNQAAIAFSPIELSRAESALSIAIQDVLTAAAADPALISNVAFRQIEQQILTTEKQIDQARRRYNEKVESLNSSISSFPQVMTAKIIGLNPQPGFEA